ncbi:hypothetical protein DPEC_G00098240, partial [Dallia pectoralis]
SPVSLVFVGSLLLVPVSDFQHPQTLIVTFCLPNAVVFSTVCLRILVKTTAVYTLVPPSAPEGEPLPIQAQCPAPWGRAPT